MSAGRFEGLPLARGAITGGVAFVVGTVFLYPLLLVSGPSLAEPAQTFPVATAFLGYAILHAWPVVLGLTPTLLLLGILPGVVLVASGYTIAAASSDSPWGGAARGATVVIGYLLAAIVGFVYVYLRRELFLAGSESAGGAAGIPPALVVIAILFTGVLFPVLFGGLGGVLAERRGH